jgi:hypothetical protein
MLLVPSGHYPKRRAFPVFLLALFLDPQRSHPFTGNSCSPPLANPASERGRAAHYSYPTPEALLSLAIPVPVIHFFILHQLKEHPSYLPHRPARYGSSRSPPSPSSTTSAAPRSSHNPSPAPNTRPLTTTQSTAPHTNMERPRKPSCNASRSLGWHCAFRPDVHLTGVTRQHESTSASQCTSSQAQSINVHHRKPMPTTQQTKRTHYHPASALTPHLLSPTADNDEQRTTPSTRAPMSPLPASVNASYSTPLSSSTRDPPTTSPSPTPSPRSWP